jgi:hypothetical protein
MCDAHRPYLKTWRFPNLVHAAAEKPRVLSAKGAVSCQPGAPPQELEWPSKRALKARFQRAAGLNRAFSAGSLVAINRGALPQAVGDGAHLALTEYKENLGSCFS